MAASLWFAQQSWGHGAQPQGAQGSVAGCNPSAMGQLWALGGGKAPKLVLQARSQCSQRMGRGELWWSQAQCLQIDRSVSTRVKRKAMEKQKQNKTMT